MGKSNKKKHSGIILPVVLIFFSVLMLLGVTIISTSGFQVKQSMSQVNRSQAYYLAKSSAEVFAEHLLVTTQELNTTTIEQYLEENYIDIIGNAIISDDLFNEAEIELSFNKVTDNMYQITSIAEYKGESVSVKLNLAYNKDVLFSDGEEIIIKANTHFVIVNNNDTYKVLESEFGSKAVVEKSENSLPNLEVPIIKKEYKNIEIDNKSTYKIFEDTLINELVIKNEGILEIDFKTKDTIVIHVKDFDFKGKITLRNTSMNTRLILFVDTFKATSNSIINEGGYPNHVLLVPTNNMTFNNNFDLTGIIYAPDKILSFGNNIDIKGVIIAHDIDKSNFNKLKFELYNTDIIIPVLSLPIETIDGSLDYDLNRWEKGNKWGK